MKIAILFYCCILIFSFQTFCQTDANKNINQDKMKKLEQLRTNIYNKYNLSESELKEIFQDKIINDTTIVRKEKNKPYDSLIVIQTYDYIIAIGKSKTRKTWNLVSLQSFSAEFFSKFDLDKNTTIDDLADKYDDTNNYVEENNDGKISKVVITLKETDDFIFITEIGFHLQNEILESISLDMYENN